MVTGSRDDIEELDRGPRSVLTDLLLRVDRYDLYGKVAYPKRHDPEEVPQIYREAARTRGVFVNPALTEPFGLTLLEAAASGLPIVATDDGGPRDIVSRCRDGLLIDPLNADDIAEKIQQVLSDQGRKEALVVSRTAGRQPLLCLGSSRAALLARGQQDSRASRPPP